MVFLSDGIPYALGLLCCVFHIAQELQCLGKILKVEPGIGFGDTGSHAVIKVRDALSAVLVILIGLNGNAGKGCIALDVLRFPEMSVAGGKPMAEQLPDVNLAAGCGQGQKVHVVNVDVAVIVRFGMLRLQYIQTVEPLCSFRTVSQHGTHGGIPVDVGVFPFQVIVPGILEGQSFVCLHQLCVLFPDTGALCPVENKLFGRPGMAGFNECLFHGVLDFLHGRNLFLAVLQSFRHLLRQGFGGMIITASCSNGCLENGIGNFLDIERYFPAVPFPYLCDHFCILPFSSSFFPEL